MALLGPSGLEILSTRNAASAMLTEEKLLEINGIELAHPNVSHFNEFVIRLPGSAEDLCQHLDRRGITAGLPLEILFPTMANNLLLVSCTDQTSVGDITALVAGIAGWIEEVET